MPHYTRLAIAVTALVSAAACSELTTGNRNNPGGINAASLSAAFSTVPTGFMSTENSFDSSAAPVGPGGWFPGAPMGGMGRQEGPGPGGGLGPMIGGGLGGDFMGGRGLGHDFGHGPFGDPALNDGSCTFDATSGRVVCAAKTQNGLTINRSVAFTTAAGVAQSAFDSITTNTINTQISVTGTQTRRDSSTSVVSNSSNRTVSGLARGSTQHTENGTAQGTETTNGTDKTGAFVAVRTATDTTSGIIVPVSDTGRTYPIAGTIIRNMTATITYSGQTPKTSTHREVITYNGTATAQMIITQDGVTRTCTLPLPFGRPTCQ